MRAAVPAHLWLPLAVALIVGLSLWSLRFFARYQPLASMEADQAGLTNVALQVQSATVTGRVGGLRRWQVSARQITFSRDERQAVVTGLEQGRLYDAQERPVATLAAGGATFQSAIPIFGAAPQGFLQVAGGLQAHLLRPYGPTLTTAGLTWNPYQNRVQSAGPVTVQFPPHPGAAIDDARMTVDGVQWDTNANLLQSAGQVRLAFARGVGSADGIGVSVNLHTGDLSLRTLTGTFSLAQGVQNGMLRKPSRALGVLSGVALLAAPLTAAPEKPVTYATGASIWLNAKHQAQMSHGVTIRQGDETLQTEAAIVNFNDQQQVLNAEARTPVHLWDTQSDLTGLHGTVDFTTHVATVKDSVVLTIKPGPQNTTAPQGSLKSRFKSPATLTCALMTYNYRTKIGTVPGPLTVHQKDRVLTADSGTYNGSLQIITLVGHVHGSNGDGEIDAPKAVIGVREGEEFVLSPQPTKGVFTPKSNKSPGGGGNSGAQTASDNPQGYTAIMNSGELPSGASTGAQQAAPLPSTAPAPSTTPSTSVSGAGTSPGASSPGTPSPSSGTSAR